MTPFFLVIRLASPLQFIRRSCHSPKETDHVLIDVHHAHQPPPLPDARRRAGSRAADKTCLTGCALITRAEIGLLEEKNGSRRGSVSGMIS